MLIPVLEAVRRLNGSFDAFEYAKACKVALGQVGRQLVGPGAVIHEGQAGVSILGGPGNHNHASHIVFYQQPLSVSGTQGSHVLLIQNDLSALVFVLVGKAALASCLILEDVANRDYTDF